MEEGQFVVVVARVPSVLVLVGAVAVLGATEWSPFFVAAPRASSVAVLVWSMQLLATMEGGA